MNISPTGGPVAPDRTIQDTGGLSPGYPPASAVGSTPFPEGESSPGISAEPPGPTDETLFSQQATRASAGGKTTSGNNLPAGNDPQKIFETEATKELSLLPNLAKMGISIRPFQPADLPQIAEIVAASFHRKFGRLNGLSQREVPELLIDFGFVSPKTSPGYMVAEKNGQILGLIQLRLPLSSEEKPVLGPWQRTVKYGFLTSVRTFLGKLLTGKGVGKDECYIEQLAVRPEARGKGVIAGLLEKGKDFASLLPGCHRLTLAVPESDKQSMTLYEKFDFSPDYSDPSLAGLVFLGVPQWHYMQLPVRKEEVPQKPRFGLLATWLHRRKKLWWLGFLGFVTLFKFPDMMSFFDGRSSGWIFFHLFWLCYFRYFLPRKV